MINSNEHQPATSEHARQIFAVTFGVVTTLGQAAIGGERDTRFYLNRPGYALPQEIIDMFPQTQPGNTPDYHVFLSARTDPNVITGAAHGSLLGTTAFRRIEAGGAGAQIQTSINYRTFRDAQAPTGFSVGRQRTGTALDLVYMQQWLRSGNEDALELHVDADAANLPNTKTFGLETISAHEANIVAGYFEGWGISRY